MTGEPARPGPLLAGPAPIPPASGRKRTRLRRTLYAIAAPLLLALVRTLWATLRVGRVAGEQHLEAALAHDGPLVICFWHEELVPNLLWLNARFGRAGRPLAFMVSPSVDGDLVTRILERTGGLVVRGSATRSGVKVLRDLYRLMAKQGASPLILPDGPQGPAREMKEGALLLSHLAGAPMLCIASASRAPWHLSTWDRMRIPKPFSRLSVAVGPLRPPAHHTGAEELEALRVELQAAQLALVEEARAAL